MCNCHHLNNSVEASPTRDEFVVGFEKLDSNTKMWTEFFICKNCNQHWIIEEGAEMDRRSNKAFKISAPKDWIDYDITPALAGWLISKHGGLSEKICLFADCEDRAINGMVFCVRHGHTEYRWK